MSEIKSTPSGGDELRAVVTATVTASQIPEEDHSYAQRILSMEPGKVVPRNAIMAEGRPSRHRGHA